MLQRHTQKHQYFNLSLQLNITLLKQYLVSSIKINRNPNNSFSDIICIYFSSHLLIEEDRY